MINEANTTNDAEEVATWEPEIDYIGIAADALMQGDGVHDLFERAYASLHCGDLECLWAVIASLCLQSSLTTRGLHPAITGDAGRGKTSGIKAGLHLGYQPAIMSNSMTPKAIFYMDDIADKTVFFIDDIIMDENLNSALKRCMSNFQDGTTHIAVNNGQNVTHKIPPRSVVINTSVFLVGDDQLRDRQLIIGVEGGDDTAYVDWEQQRRIAGERELPVTYDVELCRRIMQMIHDLDFKVHLHKPLEFLYLHDRRLINQCYDLVEASAIFNYMHRKHEVKDGVVEVWTSDEDLDFALRFSMFQMADKDTIKRLTPAERKLDQLIQNGIPKGAGEVRFSEREITNIYGKSLPAVRKLLYGFANGASGSAGRIVGGLCEHTKWYYPIYDKDTQTHMIIVKEHDINFGCVFARWKV